MPTNTARFIFKNLARLTGITATTAAGYPAANLLNSDDSLTCRATAKTLTLQGTNANLLTASGLALASTNLSPTATGRLYLYSDTAYTTQVRDTTAKAICPAPAVELEGWTAAQAASAYAYGGGADAFLWFPETAFRSWRLVIDDPNNLAAYIEAAFLMLGQYWSPTYDVDSGMGIKLCDTDVQKRSAAGSLRARAGVKWRELSLDLSNLPLADLRTLLRALRSLGRNKPFVVAVYPEDDDTTLDAETRMVGMLTSESEFTLDGPDNFATKVTITQL
jgi:hypothetical protein